MRIFFYFWIYKASMTGPEGSSYEGGVFYLHLEIPDKWLFELYLLNGHDQVILKYLVWII